MGTHRLTRAESVGLPPPTVAKLREAHATFRQGRDEVRSRRSASPEGEGLFGEEIYYESAIQEVGGDLICALVRQGDEAEASQALREYEGELSAVRSERDEAIRAGFAYKGHRQELAERGVAWERALARLRKDIAAERRAAGPSFAQRLGRGIRHLAVRD